MFIIKKYINILLFFVVILLGCNQPNSSTGINQYGLPLLPRYYTPQIYYCESLTDIPHIDGVITSNEWGSVKWSHSFISSVNAESANSTYNSMFKLASSGDSLYFAAIIHDDHIWASNDICESYFFEDNFLELAIDCDNDEFDFLILKMNALGVFCGEYWKSSGKTAHTKFSLSDTHLARCAVHVDGTVNNASDEDNYWSVEAAIPLNLQIGGLRLIEPNKSWKINIQRTKWTSIVVSGIYKKVINSKTGKKYPGEQWVWSNMGGHSLKSVELWGECHFTNNELTKKQMAHIREIKWELRNVFYAQKIHYQKHQRYSRKVAGLKDIGFDLTALIYKPDIQSQKQGFFVRIKDEETQKIWGIDQTGKITSLPYK